MVLMDVRSEESLRRTDKAVVESVQRGKGLDQLPTFQSAKYRWLRAVLRQNRIDSAFAAETSRSMFNGGDCLAAVLPVDVTPHSITIAIDLRSSVLSS
jgi:hypothetical protein